MDKTCSSSCFFFCIWVRLFLTYIFLGRTKNTNWKLLEKDFTTLFLCCMHVKTQKHLRWRTHKKQKPSLTSCMRAEKTTVTNMRASLTRAGAQTQSEKTIFCQLSWLQDLYPSTQVLGGKMGGAFTSPYFFQHIRRQGNMSDVLLLPTGQRMNCMCYCENNCVTIQ